MVDISPGMEVNILGSRDPNAVWRVLSVNVRDGSCHVRRISGGRSEVYRDVLVSEIRLPQEPEFLPAIDDSESHHELAAVTKERDRYFESAERKRAEIRALRAALERIRGMAERPVCVCGRPTGTAAIQQAATSALERLAELPMCDGGHAE